jgi:putative colanic acid biosynthesis acetyltransferase WcaF
MDSLKIDLSRYQNKLGRRNQILRFLWTIIWTLFARPIPRSLLSGWKRFLLRCFGAKIHKTSVVYSSARIYMPWALEMEEYACLGPEVDCYNVEKIKVGAHSVVSQKSYLCAASHDITNPLHPLITAPIIIKDQAWIAADSFIGMGVTIGQGAVVGARACVFKDVESWTVVGGNPAKFIKIRELNK